MEQAERDELLQHADVLEKALMEVMAGKRNASKIPVEPMVRLIAYARTGTIRNASIKAAA